MTGASSLNDLDVVRIRSFFRHEQHGLRVQSWLFEGRGVVTGGGAGEGAGATTERRRKQFVVSFRHDISRNHVLSTRVG